MIPQSLFDKTVIHQAYLVRRANGIMRDVLVSLREAESDIKAQLIRIDPTGVSKRYRAARLSKLLDSVQERIVEVSKVLSASIKADFESLATHEATIHAAMLSSTIPIDVAVAVPAADILAGIVTTTPIEGRFFKEWMATWEKATIDAMNQAIRIGVIEGETVSQISKRVMQAGDVRKRAAEQLVRTGVTHVTNEARQLTYAQNDDIITGWTFVATLDSRTTITCASLHGKTFPVGEGPRPPRHRNCRSTTIPTLKPWRDLGVDIDELSPGMQQSMSGVVPADITFSKWMRSQPASAQQDILGTARYKLFRDNKISVDYFTNDTGRVLSLDELAQKDKSLFDK